jgi:iron complex outermembrane receptor protein
MSARFRTNLKTGAWDNGVVVNYSSGYSNNSESSPTYCTTNSVPAAYQDDCARVKSNTTVDYNVAYSGFQHMKLAFYVVNLFNEEAPIQWRAGYTPQFRKFGATATYTF